MNESKLKLDAQHELLFATLHAIEELLPYAAECHDRPRPLAAARSLLGRLADQLRVHFAAEEREEYFGRIAALDPRLAHTIDGLLRDHRELRALATGLAEQARESEEPAAWHHVSRKFWLLRQRLQWHERAENDFVFELFYVDLGQSRGG